MGRFATGSRRAAEIAETMVMMIWRQVAEAVVVKLVNIYCVSVGGGVYCGRSAACGPQDGRRDLTTKPLSHKDFLNMAQNVGREFEILGGALLIKMARCYKSGMQHLR